MVRFGWLFRISLLDISSGFLEMAIFLQRSQQWKSGDDLFSCITFKPRPLDYLGGYLRQELLGNRDDSIRISYNDVARHHCEPLLESSANPHFGLRSSDAPSTDTLRRRLVPRDDRHAALLQKRRVAHTAIDDSSDTSARTHRACQQIAEAANAFRVHAGPYGNDTRRHGIDGGKLRPVSTLKLDGLAGMV